MTSWGDYIFCPTEVRGLAALSPIRTFHLSISQCLQVHFVFNIVLWAFFLWNISFLKSNNAPQWGLFVCFMFILWIICEYFVDNRWNTLIIQRFFSSKYVRLKCYWEGVCCELDLAPVFYIPVHSGDKQYSTLTTFVPYGFPYLYLYRHYFCMSIWLPHHALWFPRWKQNILPVCISNRQFSDFCQTQYLHID